MGSVDLQRAAPELIVLIPGRFCSQRPESL